MRLHDSACSRTHPARRGNATLVALVAVLVLFGMAGAILALTTAEGRETDRAVERTRALLAAEAGVANAVQEMVQAANDPARRLADGGLDMTPSILGQEGVPLALQDCEYWANVAPSGDSLWVVLGTGASGRARRAIEVVLRRAQSAVYDNALYAGNSSGDPNYVLKFGGSGAQADEITGDVYSGGGIELTGDARVDGSLRATGGINGGSGSTGVVQSPPDMRAMDYENSSDVFVADQFRTGGATYLADDAGGTAWQLPEDNPAHIFRMNPSDRRNEFQGTVKDDYFLEDPYEPVRRDATQNGSDAYRITLSGGTEPGPEGNEKVYFIDGNLWIHNGPTYSFEIKGHGQATKVTFVVKGNIYISDNIFLVDKNKDGVAFVAMKDENEPDSGNIYFGDPVGGTLEEMQAFMYAENDFVDHHLDAAGSKKVKVVGNMTAGNQVRIERDNGNQHSKLTVEFDDRISSGALTLPGLPSQNWGAASFTTLSWREVPVD